MLNNEIIPSINQRKNLTFIIMGVLLVIIATAAIAGFLYIDEQNNLKISALEDRIIKLSHQIKASETVVQDIKLPREPIDDSAGKLTEKKVNNLYNALASSASVFQAVSELRKAINSGRSFTDQLNKLNNLLPNSRTITDPLATLALNGVPSAYDLANYFKDSFPKNYYSHSTPTGNWHDVIVEKILSLVTIRKINEGTDVIDAGPGYITHLLLNNKLQEAYEYYPKISLSGANHEQWRINLKNLILVSQTIQHLENNLLKLIIEAAELN